MDLKYSLLSTAVFSLLLVAGVMGARNDLTIEGNETHTNYYRELVSTTQLNNSVNSSSESYWEAQINISMNDTAPGNDGAGATLVNISLTLGDQWAVNTTTKVQLQNSSRIEIQEAANISGADGLYPNITIDMSGLSLTVDNSTNTTFYIIYRLKALDDNKTKSDTDSGIHHTENVTYYGPSDLTLNNVTIEYKPDFWTTLANFKSVQWNGTTLGRGTNPSGEYVTYPDGIRLGGVHNFTPDSTDNWLYVSYSEQTSGSTGSAGSAGTGTVSAPPQSQNYFQWLFSGFGRFFSWLFGGMR